MELEKLKRSTIVKLKKIKDEQDLSIKKIMDLIELTLHTYTLVATAILHKVDMRILYISFQATL